MRLARLDEAEGSSSPQQPPREETDEAERWERSDQLKYWSNASCDRCTNRRQLGHAGRRGRGQDHGPGQSAWVRPPSATAQAQERQHNGRDNTRKSMPDVAWGRPCPHAELQI